MQRISQFWKASVVSKMIIVVGFLIMVCFCCIAFPPVYTAISPSYQATVTACAVATATELARPINTPRPTNTARPTETPKPATNTPRPTNTVRPTEIPKPINTLRSTNTPTMLPTLTQTRTPSYYIPSLFWGQEFILIDKCVLRDDNCGRLPDELQAKVGETAFTNVDGIRLELKLQDVLYVIDRQYRNFITTFEFKNPSDKTFTIVSEEFFDTWGNYDNWRGAVAWINTKANFEIRPGSTQLDLEWTTNAHNNLIVFVTVNSVLDRRSIIIDENSVVYRVEFPPIPTKTPTPTRTPVN